MSISPDKLTSLARWGMADVLIRASKFDPPIGSRGILPNAKPVEWAVTITPANPARPMVRAIREDMNEAVDAAVDRFLAIFRDKKDLDPFGEAVTAPAPKKKPAAKPKPVIDEDDLI